jgi:hypothetical protein
MRGESKLGMDCVSEHATEILAAVGVGDKHAAEELLPLVYLRANGAPPLGLRPVLALCRAQAADRAEYFPGGMIVPEAKRRIVVWNRRHRI